MPNELNIPEIKLPEIKLPGETGTKSSRSGSCRHGHADCEDVFIDMVQSLADLEGHFDYLVLQYIVKLWEANTADLVTISNAYTAFIQALCCFQNATANTIGNICSCTLCDED